jgi:hypothetical protein
VTHDPQSNLILHRTKLTGILLHHWAFLLLTDTKEKGLEIFLLQSIIDT